MAAPRSAPPSRPARSRPPRPAAASGREPGPFYSGERYTIEESCGYLLRRVYGSIQRHIEKRVQPLDLTALQWAPLLLLAKGKGNTAAELARWMEIDPGAMTRMLDRLECKRLIARRRCAADRRVVTLALTPEGEAVIARIPDIVAEVLNLHLEGFTAAEFATLMKLLRRMLANGTDRGAERKAGPG